MFQFDYHPRLKTGVWILLFIGLTETIYTVHVFSSHQDTHQTLMEKQLVKRKLFVQVEGTLWSSAMEQCLYEFLFCLYRAAIFTFTSVVSSRFNLSMSLVPLIDIRWQ